MISLLVPTRNRPTNVQRLYQSLVDTTTNIADIELCFYIDEDDSVSLPVITRIAEKINTQCVQGPPAPSVRVPTWITQNSLQKQAKGPIFMFAADDIVFRTPGWDVKVKEQFDRFEDKIVLVYGPDGFQTGVVPVCTHGFVHQHWIDITGCLLPSYFDNSHGDTWLTDVAERVGRRIYLTDVYFEHLHPAAGKAMWDSTYTTKQESPGGEANIYQRSSNERQGVADRLKQYIALFK